LAIRRIQCNPATVVRPADFVLPATALHGNNNALVNGRGVVADVRWCGDSVFAGELIIRG
jgi:hypothetical protein